MHASLLDVSKNFFVTNLFDEWFKKITNLEKNLKKNLKLLIFIINIMLQ
jgi:hypothetical protein